MRELRGWSNPVSEGRKVTDRVLKLCLFLAALIVAYLFVAVHQLVRVVTEMFQHPIH